jgi:uncharacterized protein (TIGR02246 family)
VAQRLVRAWNEGTAEALAALFTAHADYVGADGVRRRGRGAIEEMRRTAVNAPTVAIEGAVSIRSHGDVATVLFSWSAREGTGPARRGVITCVVVRRKGRWLIDRLHNTNVS